MTDKIRWGIMSTGYIATEFAKALAILPDAEMAAVGSRSQASADAFGMRFDIPHRHAGYEALAEDPDVDVVYIGTPHNLHRENALLCLDAGKAVLCEKPFTINAAEAQEIIEVARRKQLFLMEAMWTRFIPAIRKIRGMLADGVIGEPRMVMAEFGFRPPFEPDGRLFDPQLGGGALLDLGIYPITLAWLIFGPPQEIVSRASIGATGVDEQNAVVLSYGQGQLAVLASSLQAETPQEAHIIGTQGRIRIHAQWWHPTMFTLSLNGREDQTITVPMGGNGYNYEAAEVMSCLRAGKPESNVMPLDESLAIMKILDQLRAQWGMSYPME
ncbi:MAG: Gfo/Idh/MocA family oxidoreductase [Anaerolineae bacterium]|nr:Gfo/Idh/MocA family oxidoreductase [Anaerolineae bacterium]